MRILIIGYGSIGKKHYQILKKNFTNIKFFILSKRKISVNGAIVLKSLEEIKTINPNYVIIASEPSNHFFQLKFLENNFKNIKILVEKPLFHKKINFISKKNKVYLGYNLRFHPHIAFLKEFLKKNKPIDIKIITNSYLPHWRSRNYSLNYSSNRSKGGGVILDLSHEIDLILWLFGNIKISYFDYGKISNLKIKSEDYLKLFGSIKNSKISLDLSYYSRNEIRHIFVDSNKNSIFIDLKKNIFKLNSKIQNNSLSNFSFDNTYLSMHKAIIHNRKSDYLYSFKEGNQVINFITKLKNRRRLLARK